jgi:hypothetical protein
MQNELKDPFNAKYFLLALVVLALPLLHVIAGWATFYFR